MKHVAVLTFCLLAVACASNNAPPPERPEASRSAPSPHTAPKSDVLAMAKTPSPDCANLCSSYHHYKLGALYECSEGGCDGHPTHPVAAEYGRELRDDVIASCGAMCVEASDDLRKAKSAGGR